MIVQIPMENSFDKYKDCGNDCDLSTKYLC